MVVAAVVVIHPESANLRLNVCHAGSLQAAFADVEKAFTKQHPDVTLTDVSGGSVTLARRLASGVQACDVYASADYLDIERLLEPARLVDYGVVFAKGRMVLAYLATDPKTQGVARPGAFNPPATVTMPGLGVAGATASSTIPAISVAWGATIIKTSPNQENAIAFLNLLLGPTGTAALNTHGPAPVTPAIVRPGDYAHVPKTMQPLVTAKPIAP